MGGAQATGTVGLPTAAVDARGEPSLGPTGSRTGPVEYEAPHRSHVHSHIARRLDLVLPAPNRDEGTVVAGAPSRNPVSGRRLRQVTGIEAGAIAALAQAGDRR